MDYSLLAFCWYRISTPYWYRYCIGNEKKWLIVSGFQILSHQKWERRPIWKKGNVYTPLVLRYLQVGNSFSPSTWYQTSCGFTPFQSLNDFCMCLRIHSNAKILVLPGFRGRVVRRKKKTQHAPTFVIQQTCPRCWSKNMFKNPCGKAQTENTWAWHRLINQKQPVVITRPTCRVFSP